MPTGPQFRESVLAAKERLAEGREKLRAQHDRASPGIQVCARLTDLLDTVVMNLFDAALAELNLEHLRRQVALVPHGGYGRRDVAPFSDVDLMILHSGAPESEVAALAKRLMQDLYDAGLKPGHSVRTPTQAVQLARGDATICTSLFESRFLAGQEPIFMGFHDRLKKMVKRRFRALHEAIVEARRDERSQFGETVYLLAPNVKRSRGGLRDIQLLRWIGFARFGTSDPDSLQLLGALTKLDRHRLRSALEFLLRVRNEMHFHAGKAEDLLARDEQVRIATVFGYLGSDALLPVEQFMREYFRHTSQVSYLVSRFVNSMLPDTPIVRLLAPMFSHSVERDYRVGPNQISATRSGVLKLKESLYEVLRLADLANLYNKRIDHATWEAVCQAAPNYPEEISDDVAARFLSLLVQPARLGELLRRLHELGVLEKIIPAFTHARSLLQFNEYHKYTVDEHSFKAVEAVTEFARDSGPLGTTYRELKDKRPLHLALLLHDLGKGFAEDHSVLGERIAIETCQRLHVSAEETALVALLVRKHLVMSHLAFRRDTSDDQIIVRFAVEIGSLEALTMLYLVTCADLAAVGPGVLNQWKVEVLTDIYRRASQHLAGNVATGVESGLARRRAAVEAQIPAADRDDFLREHIAALPGSYLQVAAPDKIVAMLRRLRQLRPREGAAWGEYLEGTRTVEFTAIVDQGHGRGVFSRLTGALTSQGLEILSAEINSLAGEAILDRFVVLDPDYAGPPPQDRIDSVCRALVHSLDSAEPPKFRKLWGGDPRQSLRKLSQLSTDVKIDNHSSDNYTIIDVFTFDRTGLLYAVARELLALRLSIGAARIGTYLDQVVDVFYVTDNQGQKIEDHVRLEEIRTSLLAAIAGGADGAG